MAWEGWIALLTIALVLYALARNLAGPDVILMGGAVLFVTLGVVSDKFPAARQVAATFGNEGLLTVAVLFVVAAALTETGGMAMISERVLACRARPSMPRCG